MRGYTCSSKVQHGSRIMCLEFWFYHEKSSSVPKFWGFLFENKEQRELISVHVCPSLGICRNFWGSVRGYYQLFYFCYKALWYNRFSFQESPKLSILFLQTCIYLIAFTFHFLTNSLSLSLYIYLYIYIHVSLLRHFLVLS